MKKKWYVLVLLVITASVYSTTIARTHVSFGDSDELTTIGYHLGVAHPPGYPVLMIFIGLFTHLPFLPNPAAGANLLALVIQLFNLVLLFNLLTYLMQKIRFPPAIHLPAALFTSLYTAFTPPFWFQANVIEKYSFILLLILVTANLVLINHPWKRFALAGVTAMGLAHHELYGIGIALLALGAWWQGKQRVRLNRNDILGFTTGVLLTIGSLWFLNLRPTPFSFNFPETASGLVHHLLRSSYASASSSLQFSTTAFTYFDQAFLHFAKNLVVDYLYLPLVLACYGWYRLYEKSKKKALLLTAPFVVYGPLLLIYIGWPAKVPSTTVSYLNQVYLIERWYLFPYVFLAGGLCLGLAYLIKSFQKNRSTIMTIMGALVVVLIGSTYPSVNLRSFHTTANLTRSLLDSLPADSILIAGSDYAGFGLAYQTLVEHYRADVDVFVLNWRFRSKHLRTQNLVSFTYPHNPELTLELIARNITKRPIYFVDMPENYYQLLGVNQGLYGAVPYGQLIQIQSSPSNSGSLPHLHEAVVLPGNQSSFFNYLNGLHQDRIRLANSFSHHPNLEMLTYDTLINAATYSLYQGNYDQAHTFALGALLRDPNSPAVAAILDKIPR